MEFIIGLLILLFLVMWITDAFKFEYTEAPPLWDKATIKSIRRHRKKMENKRGE